MGDSVIPFYVTELQVMAMFARKFTSSSVQPDDQWFRG